MASTNRVHPISPQAAAERYAKRKLGKIDHEGRVLAIARQLFELTRVQLELCDADLRLLSLAAVLHDVGRSVNDKDHPEEGARLLLGTTALDLSPFERRALAMITLCHRGAVPAQWEEPFLKPADPRRSVRIVLGLLRVADALDNRQIVSPNIVLTRRQRRLHVACYVPQADLRDARRIYKRRKKFHLLEEFLGSEIDVTVAAAEELAVV